MDTADRRMVTVLFADIVGSTGIVALADPEEAHDRLTRTLDLIAAQIRHQGGTVCQTMGDGILALFGAPAAQEDHALRACLAAESAQRMVASASGAGLAVRIGIASGEVLFDHAAAGRSDRPPAIGRCVHLAARLQQGAPPHGIRLSDATAAAVAAWMDLEPAGTLDFALGDRVPMSTLLGSRPRRSTGGDEPLAGRETLRSTLLAAVDLAAAGHGQAHLLVGEAGLGKTRLALALAAAARRAGIGVVELQCQAVRPLGAPDPLEEVLAGLWGAPPAIGRADLLLQMHQAGLTGPAAAALADLLRPAGGPAPTPDPGLLLGRAVDGMAALALAAAARAPLLLVLEDLHWAGPEVTALVHRLSRSVADAPLLLLATSRQDIGPADGAALHRLDPLPPEAARAMLESLMGPDPALEEVKAALIRRAAGNPFFLAESVRDLRRSGALAGPAGGMRLIGPVPDRLPDTVQALLASRLDALPEAERDLLRSAAVIGPVFDADLLAALTGPSRVAVRSRLRTLAEAGFLTVTRLLPQLEYRFHHALLHEAAYATLTRKDRNRLHQALADLLQRPEAAGLAGREAALARHAFLGGRWAVAVTAAQAAARLAQQQARVGDAADLLDMALQAHGELAEEGEAALRRELALRLDLAVNTMPAGRRGDVGGHLARSIDLARALGDLQRQVQAHLMRVGHAWLHGTLPEAVRRLEEAAAASGRMTRDGGPHGHVLVQGACIHIAEGLTGRARALVAEVRHRRAACLDGVPPVMRLDADVLLCSVSAQLSALDRDATGAERWVRRAAARAQQTGYAFDWVCAAAYASETWNTLGRHAAAREEADLALDLMQETGAALYHDITLANRGHARLMLGDADGRADLERALALSRQRGVNAHRLTIQGWLADALFRAGDLDAAAAMRAEMQAFALRTGRWTRTGPRPSAALGSPCTPHSSSTPDPSSARAAVF